MKPEIKEWQQELEKTVKSYDVKAFRRFYAKWKARGFYEIELPRNDRVIEIMMRKMVYNLNSSTEAEKQEAREWLERHGCDTSFGY